MQSAALAPARLAPPAIVLPAFATTLFLSAGLMFLVEPMIAKMVLPRLGGSPAVWSTCLVFFQGDARLTLAGAPDGSFDVLVLDAFSSDSIPMHLLTREALALYLRKLAPGGTLLFHISSRTLDLRPVIAALAADAGVPARMLLDHPPAGTVFWRREAALVVAVAGRGGGLERLDRAEGWVELPPAGARSLWTDQRSDILWAIRFGL